MEVKGGLADRTREVVDKEAKLVDRLHTLVDRRGKVIDRTVKPVDRAKLLFLKFTSQHKTSQSNKLAGGPGPLPSHSNVHLNQNPQAIAWGQSQTYS
ncbi:hypothetical protein V1502_17690 [Bacillus sp. SCS-153A]|uniref:hypothetical protein n=1 Tax=Rossellomorea sedimentorum TaxID=3115294 RepID=UPI0039059EC9